MAENPLLPDEQLRALLSLTRECARLDTVAKRAESGEPAKQSGSDRSASKRRPGGGSLWPSREALIAGTMLHLQPGDVLLPEASDAVSLRLAPRPASGEAPRPLLPASLGKELGGRSPRLLLGAGMAAALRAGGSDRLVMVHLSPDLAEPNWQAALSWAQQALLPLIVVCGDTRGTGAFRAPRRVVADAPGWDAVQRVASRLQLPVLSVDGEDAVAVYRVTQESVLRARAHAGPALLWAMLPSLRDAAADRPANTRPVARLQRYLRARKVSVRSV